MLLDPANPQPPARFQGVISSGSLRADLSLPDGGIPCGSICEIFGPPGGGKTSLCHAIIAGAQRKAGSPHRGVCAYVDVEGALETGYAARSGVDLDRLLVCRPGAAETALDIVETLARSGEVAVLVIDSATALLPGVEISAGIGAGDNSSAARLLAHRLPRLKQAALRSGAVIIFTSQQAVQPGPGYFGADKTAAGIALKLHAAVRMEVNPGDPLLRHGRPVGNQASIRLVKPKNIRSIPTNKIDIMYNNGICRNGEIFDLAMDRQLIQTQEGGYFYQGLGLGRTREACLAFLQEDPDLADQLERAVRQEFSPPA